MDLRQLQLAFNNSVRIVAVLVVQGDRVKKAQVLASLDMTGRVLAQGSPPSFAPVLAPNQAARRR